MRAAPLRVFIGGYKGVSLISTCIKTVTWNRFSHVALINDRGITIQSWYSNGTQKDEHPWITHTPGTPIDIFALDYPVQLHARVWARAITKIGSDYDFRALLGFIPGLRYFWKDDPSKWFCSHQVADDCCVNGDHRLFNDQLPMYKIDPGLLVASPRLRFLGEVLTRNQFRDLIAV